MSSHSRSILSLLLLLAIGAIGFGAWSAAQDNASSHTDHDALLKNPDGSWKHTNRLVDSTSPYLLQHAHNPVDWLPWDANALELAKKEDKPIFLSVGYSTCYWCHVMEREVFSDPEIAAMMNERFINIKVDREQRPDLDEIYMTATQLFTQRGGWPNSVFLTPDLKPFFAGTYFGPKDQPGRPGFPTLITALADAWEHRRADVEAAGDQLTEAIRDVLGRRLEQLERMPLTLDIPSRAVDDLARRFDERMGGFGQAPKFPQGYYFPFLFDEFDRTDDSKPREMALHTLRMMASGGIYDHVGGGFHRYSTDGQWRVPHYEKMLYNQAQLTRAYVAAYEQAGDPMFADVARDILRYVDDLMTGPDGQFYSALDAETDAVEGAYYVWKRDEVKDVLGEEDFDFFEKVFGFAPVPAYPGHKHPDGKTLYMLRPIDDAAEQLGVDPAELRRRLDDMLRRLKERRDRRPLPRLDDKVVTAWNGLMIGAYAHAGRALDDPALLEKASRAASFVLERMRLPDGRLYRVWRQGVAEQPAFQEDYAYLLRGLTILHEATGEARWLDAALELTEIANRLFWDEGRGGYFYAPEAPDRIARSKSPRDGALPSGNGAMAHALLDLARLTGEASHRERARALLETFSGLIHQSPSGYLHMTHAAQRLLTASEAQPAPEQTRRDWLIPPTDLAPSVSPDIDVESLVDVSVTSNPAEASPGEEVVITITLDIADGWHINANPASSPNLIPTMIDVRSDPPVQIIGIEHPTPLELTPPYARTPISVHQGRTVITATVRAPAEAPDTGVVPLRILVQYQPCDDARCLQPVEEVIETTLLMRPDGSSDGRR